MAVLEVMAELEGVETLIAIICSAGGRVAVVDTMAVLEAKTALEAVAALEALLVLEAVAAM